MNVIKKIIAGIAVTTSLAGSLLVSASDEPTKDWFVKRLQGEAPEPLAAEIPSADETQAAQAGLWADCLLDLDKPVIVMLNGKEVFKGKIERSTANMADDIILHGDPGRIFPARVQIKC